MQVFYTYLHCKPDGTPFYVGKGKGGRSHEFAKGRNKHHKNTIAKYGIENIIVRIFECDFEQQAFADEIKQIAQLRSEGHSLVNQTDGGEGSSGYKHSAVALEKMRLANIGKELSATTRAKISAAGKGAKRSPETKAKISAFQSSEKNAHRGKPMHANTRAALEKAWSNVSEETRLKQSEALKGNQNAKGYKHSDETRKKISNGMKGRGLSDEHRAKKSVAQTGKKNHRFGKVGTMSGRKHTPESIAKMIAGCKIRDEKRRLLKMQEAN